MIICLLSAKCLFLLILNSLFNVLFLLRLLKLANSVVSSAYIMNLNNLLEKEISFK